MSFSSPLIYFFLFVSTSSSPRNWKANSEKLFLFLINPHCTKQPLIHHFINFYSFILTSSTHLLLLLPSIISLTLYFVYAHVKLLNLLTLILFYFLNTLFLFFFAMYFDHLTLLIFLQSSSRYNFKKNLSKEKYSSSMLYCSFLFLSLDSGWSEEGRKVTIIPS